MSNFPVTSNPNSSNLSANTVNAREKLVIGGQQNFAQLYATGGVLNIQASCVSIPGKLIVSGPTELNGPITSGNQVVNVPGDYSSIQSAIDALSGHVVGCKTIKVAKGKYIENLDLTKLSSSVANGDGFIIIGDERRIVGQSYVHNLLCRVPPGTPNNIGTNAQLITLINGLNTVQVLIAGINQVNFEAAGVVEGDTIKIRDNSDVWHNRTVTNVTLNTLTYDGDPVTVGGFKSALSICPNVEILSETPSSFGAHIVSGCSVIFKGIWFNSDVGRGSAFNRYVIYSEGGTVEFKTCLLDNSKAIAQYFILSKNSNVQSKTDSLTIIGGVSFDSTTVKFSFVSIFERFIEGINDCDLEILNCILGKSFIDMWGGFIRGLNNAIVGVPEGLVGQECSGYFAGGQNFIDCSSDGMGTRIPRSLGIRLISSRFTFGGVISNADQGMILRGASSLVNQNDYASGFVNCGVQVLRSAESSYEDRSLNPQSIYPVIADGPMDTNFLVQNLVGETGVELELNPSITSTRPAPPDQIKYASGKSYTLYSGNNQAHSLKLVSSANFTGWIGGKTDLSLDPLQSTMGSNIVTVTHNAHTLANGDTVFIQLATAFNGILVSALNRTHIISNVTPNTYDITLTTNATATGSGGGANVDAYTEGSGPGNRLIVTSVTSGFITSDQLLTGMGITSGTTILSNLYFPTPALGGVGVYVVSETQDVTSTSIVSNADPVFIGGGSGNIATFAPGVGNYLKFVVVAPQQVLVTDLLNVSFM